MEQCNSDEAYQDFKHHLLYQHLPHRVFIKSNQRNDNEAAYRDFAHKMAPQIADYRPPADLKKVDQPEILGDIMKADWITEGDSDAICD